MKRLIAGIAAVLSVGAAAAVLELPKIFSSHMVLQRETAVPVFGRAASGVEVEVSFAGVRQRTLGGRLAAAESLRRRPSSDGHRRSRTPDA